MNKKLLFTVSVCSMLAINMAYAKSPVDGGGNYQTIDASTAQAYIMNYKNNVSNKFAEFYVLDLTAISTAINSGASAIRVYNGITAAGAKVAVMAPVDVNYNNIAGMAQMAAISTVGICPPNCDVSKSSSAVMMTTLNAQNAATNYYNNPNYDRYNAFLIYPGALNALKNSGCIYFQVCNAINTNTGGRCMIYRGVTASGNAMYYMQDAGSMSNHLGME